MLNAMPLPIGPTEIPSGITKPDMRRKTLDRGASGENATNFSSTLEAAHQNSQKSGNNVNHKDDDTSDVQSTSEDKDATPQSKDRTSPSDGAFNQMGPEQTSLNNDLGLELSANNFAVATASEETSTVSDTETMNAAEMLQEETNTASNPNTPDLQKETLATPQPETPELIVPGQSAGANADAQGAVNGEDVVTATLSQEGPNTLKSVKAVLGAEKSGLGPQLSQSAVDQSTTQASQVTEAAGPDTQTTPKTPSNASSELTEKAAKVDDLLAQPVLEERESQLSNKENPAPHPHRQAALNRQTETNAPTPGKMKAEALEEQPLRAHTADDAAETPKAFGDNRAPEAPLAMVNDDASPMAGRPGGLDDALAFSTSTASGKVGMASGQTAAAPTADTFSQDNFHQLVERALFTVRGEQSEARIALKPDHLGHVQMKIVTEHNLVSVKIITETPVARDLIDANANQLKAELQHQGLTVESIEVSVSDERQDAYRQARQRDAFLRNMTSQGRSSLEKGGEFREHGPAQRNSHRNSVRGIDYFA